MATKKTTSKSRKTSTAPLGWIAAVIVLAVLLIGTWANSITRVDVGTVKLDLAALQAQMTEQAQATEAPAAATEAPVETEEAPVATEEAVAEAPAAQPAPETDRLARLVELDVIYRSSGWQAWLKAAGVQCDANVEARQPEEETIVYNGETRVVVSGIQLRGNCKVAWPALVTTDRPAEVTTSTNSRTYQPDLKNPSVLYTNVDLHGQGTVWVDGSNWGQLDPLK